MIDLAGSRPLLPMVLWNTPPGLELALGQEGVPFVKVGEPHRMAFLAGRFVLFDGSTIAPAKVGAMLSRTHIAIDIDVFRQQEKVDPFRALIDTEASTSSWSIEGFKVVERVSRYPKAPIRRRLIDQIRNAVVRRGGIWARLAPFPFPYRSAFNLRLDLDEPVESDYLKFAEARRPIDDCSTHFVSTRAYGENPRVLDDLRQVDTQSHGHHHFIYREAEANLRNLKRAHQRLVDAGFRPEGFAGPHGRWNEGVDAILEDLGYSYSSDFQLGYDDLPFFPWRVDRFSKILQVPVHPLCEGIFFEAGADPRVVLDHFVRVIRSKVASGEPAFVYGHPERRLGLYPEIVRGLAEALGRESMVWRTTLTAFARWWRWRAGRRWSVVNRGDERIEVQFDDWDNRYPLALELIRGSHAAVIPLDGPRTSFCLQGLAYARRETRADLPMPSPFRGPRSLKNVVRNLLDWETVTPIEDLHVGSLTARVKRELRRWKRER